MKIILYIKKQNARKKNLKFKNLNLNICSIIHILFILKIILFRLSEKF